MPTMEYLKHFSNSEKIFLVYTFLLIILLVTLPLFKTWSLSSSETISYGFFNLWMIKTDILALIVIVVLLWWNLSANIRKHLSDFFSFRASDAFVNFLCLFMLILLMFGIWDTVWVIESNFSQRVSTTSSYYITLLYLIWWLLISWYLAYNDWWKMLRQEEKIDVPHEEDIRNTDAFKKVEEEFSWLFDDHRAWDITTSTPPPAAPSTPQTSDYIR